MHPERVHLVGHQQVQDGGEPGHDEVEGGFEPSGAGWLSLYHIVSYLRPVDDISNSRVPQLPKMLPPQGISCREVKWPS